MLNDHLKNPASVQVMKLCTIPKSRAIDSIRPELRSRGVVWIAEDCRGQYQMVGQTSVSIMHAMQYLCRESHSKSVVCDIASRGGQTGSFRIFKLPLKEAVAYLQSTRLSFEKQVIATHTPTQYLTKEFSAA